MKQLLFLFIVTLFVAGIYAQDKDISRADTTKKIQIVEASCGLCQFGMKTEDCSLAVRIKGKTYLVQGTNIDAHGDAHADDGFCKAIRKAEVQGEIINNRFIVTYFKLLPATKDKPVEKADTN